MNSFYNNSLIVFFVFSSFVLTAQQDDERRPERRERPSVEQIFKDLDTNEDSKISLDEAKGPLQRDFNKVDLNEDGFITKQELEEAPKPKHPPRNPQND